MKIGIVTDKNTEDAVVAESFEKGGYLIIVETETMAAQAMIPNTVLLPEAMTVCP